MGIQAPICLLVDTALKQMKLDTAFILEFRRCLRFPSLHEILYFNVITAAGLRVFGKYLTRQLLPRDATSGVGKARRARFRILQPARAFSRDHMTSYFYC